MPQPSQSVRLGVHADDGQPAQTHVVEVPVGQELRRMKVDVPVLQRGLFRWRRGMTIEVSVEFDPPLYKR